MEDLKIGDIVILKSGSARMTVSKFTGSAKNRVVCAWYVDGEIKYEEFEKAMLTMEDDTDLEASFT